MAMVLPSVNDDQSLTISLRVRWVIVQKRKRIVVAESRALIVFTMRAT